MHVLEKWPSDAMRIEQPGAALPSRLELRFTSEDSRTRMTVSRQDPPWRAIRAFQNAGGQAVVHLHNVSGGVLSGDHLDLSIRAGRQTRVQVTTVGATRVYRHRAGRDIACLSTAICVAEGGMVEYLPDPLIPFGSSQLTQSTSVRLDANSGFIGWETIAAGRTSRGEEFEFTSLASEFSIRSNARPLAIERFRLAPAVRDSRSAARWGRFRYSGALYICHTGIGAPVWMQLESRLNELASARTDDNVRWGVSALYANGVVVRGLGLEAHHIASGLNAFWDHAKRDIWAEPAIPPRKIN